MERMDVSVLSRYTTRPTWKCVENEIFQSALLKDEFGLFVFVPTWWVLRGIAGKANVLK